MDQQKGAEKCEVQYFVETPSVEVQAERLFGAFLHQLCKSRNKDFFVILNCKITLAQSGSLEGICEYYC